MRSCWLMSPQPENVLRVVVAYICVTDGNLTDAYSPRFVRTYQENPSGYPHDLYIICNGGPLPPRKKSFFDALDCEFFERPNDEGKDLSGYQDLAERLVIKNEADFLVCFGESIYFHRTGWLERLVAARLAHGPGMYGCFSSHMVRAHLNTTGFGIDPKLITKYPKVRTNAERYNCEHGQNCMWKRLVAGKNTAALVTFQGVYFQGEWRRGDGIMHRDKQENCLAWCNHTSKFEQGDPPTRQLWSSQSDSPYRI